MVEQACRRAIIAAMLQHRGVSDNDEAWIAQRLLIAVPRPVRWRVRGRAARSAALPPSAALCVSSAVSSVWEALRGV